MKSFNGIETATPKEIAKYLEYLHDTAWEKANHKTDDDSNEYTVCDEDINAYTVWKKLYDFVFSGEISKKIYERFGELDYYDPDASYYEDVTAYINAFKEFAENYGGTKKEPDLFPSFEEYKQMNKCF